MNPRKFNHEQFYSARQLTMAATPNLFLVDSMIATKLQALVEEVNSHWEEHTPLYWYAYLVQQRMLIHSTHLSELKELFTDIFWDTEVCRLLIAIDELEEKIATCHADVNRFKQSFRSVRMHQENKMLEDAMSGDWSKRIQEASFDTNIGRERALSMDVQARAFQEAKRILRRKSLDIFEMPPEAQKQALKLAPREVISDFEELIKTRQHLEITKKLAKQMGNYYLYHPHNRLN